MGFSSSNKNSSSSYRPMAEINVTPMVDIMLVLLIIFMVTSPMLLAGVDVDLPESKAGAITSSQDPISITLDAKGKLYIQNTTIPEDQLVQKLKSISKQNFNIRIYVRGDRNLNYGTIMRVIGNINNAGFRQVSLVGE